MTLYVPTWSGTVGNPVAAARELTNTIMATGAAADPDLKVGARGAGANMSVDVAPGRVFVDARCCWSDAIVNKTIGAPPAGGLQRIDSIQAQVSGTTWDIVVVAGTSAATPSAPSVPAGATELARVLLTSGTASITSANLTDTRLFAAPITASDHIPTVAREGQAIVLPTGRTLFRTGGVWKYQPGPSQYGGNHVVMTSTPLGSTPTSYAISTVATVPAGPVTVAASFNGRWLTGSGLSNAIVDLSVQISLNGGTTYSSGVEVSQTSTNNLLPAAVAAQFLLSGSPTGDIKSRITANRGGASGSLLGSLQTTVTPA